MNELFDSKAVSLPSPRLRWLEKHNVKTWKSPHLTESEKPWNCWQGKFDDALVQDAIAFGPTEDEAITNWAKVNGVRLWNEENA